MPEQKCTRPAPSRRRVVIVEDDPDTASVLAAVLDRAGLSPTVAASHADCVAVLAASSEPPTAVIASFSVAGAGASLRLADALRTGAAAAPSETQVVVIGDCGSPAVALADRTADTLLRRPVPAARLLAALCVPAVDAGSDS